MERTLMSKNHVLTFLTPFSSKTTSSSSKTYTPLSHTSSLHQITLKTKTNSTTKITKNKPNGLPKNEPKITIPTMRDIIASSKQQKVELKLHTLGPFFRITAKRLGGEEEIGRAEGIIRVWFGGKILHLDSIKLTRETLGMEKSIFGIGVFLGAVAVRYGYDCGCTSAELLAINDSDLYHNKLIRFYTRIGFKKVYEVTGSTFGDYSHMLVWGGVGTRMEASVEHLLVKWCTRFIPKK
ncbi:Polycomb group protein like [Heracleum sosnowskyi]|uniref:Polycomb group protein like n=1 Tax=Heracleum sosnowskyi TaxID=360622 RepID=A0AAD8MVY0_9APIA|nr:Polycomb group protein like [Heracleum sosnowskyi]